jgi:hypothetical protein
MFGRETRMLDHEWIPDDRQKLVLKIRETVRSEFVRISDLEVRTWKPCAEKIDRWKRRAASDSSLPRPMPWSVSEMRFRLSELEIIRVLIRRLRFNRDVLSVLSFTHLASRTNYIRRSTQTTNTPQRFVLKLPSTSSIFSTARLYAFRSCNFSIYALSLG